MDLKHNYVVGRPKLFSQERFKARVEGILESNLWGNNGPITEELEQAYCDFTGSKYAVAVSNATVGLELVVSFSTLFRPKMRVAVPSFTFVATASCTKRFGHEIVLIDSDWDFNIDLDHLVLEHAKNKIDLVIIPELFGNRMNHNVEELAKNLGIIVVWDRAHALGIPSSPGLAQIYSHHPTKICGGFEMGVITTNNQVLDLYLRSVRNFGFDQNSLQEANAIYLGTNAKTSEIAAAAVLTQLEDFEPIKSHYRKIYDRYNLELKDLDNCHVNAKNTKDSNYSYVTMYAKHKARLKDFLALRGIHTKSYFRPLHMQNEYLTKEVLFMSETLYRNLLTLPSGLHIQIEDVKMICDKIKEFYA